MITRFYVDNYKCLVNFEYKPKPFELILGANGTGKTTVFEALACLQEFILNQKAAKEVFPGSSTTRWQNRDDIQFEIELLEGNHAYRYELYLTNAYNTHVLSEDLWDNGKKIFEYNFKLEQEEDMESVFLEVRVNIGVKERSYRVPEYEKSAIGNFANGFKKAMGKITFIRMQPNLMLPTVTISQQRPNRSFSNFPAYYLHLLQEKQGMVFDLLPVLRENVQGFRAFALEERGKQTRHLRVEFAVDGGKKGQIVRYDFDELSDGQRALIALYTVAFCEADSTLFIDEPENFISSRELQPWLMLLQERIEDYGGQAILISHHPEFINVMAPQDAIQFRRKNGGPVQIRPFETEQYQGLTPAEIVARGWENE